MREDIEDCDFLRAVIGAAEAIAKSGSDVDRARDRWPAHQHAGCGRLQGFAESQQLRGMGFECRFDRVAGALIDEEKGEVVPPERKGNLYVFKCQLGAAPCGRPVHCWPERSPGALSTYE